MYTAVYMGNPILCAKKNGMGVVFLPTNFKNSVSCGSMLLLIRYLACFVTFNAKCFSVLLKILLPRRRTQRLLQNPKVKVIIFMFCYYYYRYHTNEMAVLLALNSCIKYIYRYIYVYRYIYISIVIIVLSFVTAVFYYYYIFCFRIKSCTRCNTKEEHRK